MKLLTLIALPALFLFCTPVENQPTSEELQVREVVQSYVEGWRNMDEEQVLSVFEDGARISPNSLNPIEGKENLKNFWFPDDGSQTIINRYEIEIIDTQIMDSLAITTHTSVLDWDYINGETEFGRIQNGISTIVYRKQNDDSWKIWRAMWTDIKAIPK
ncbi:MAG: hypothetical protein JJ971_10685 [Balneolaceae bacterium]|nr:hypothetical protein [Balneolaceae bacterium]MBO6546288.1 hypothetical protein [Balneolaceae bacterium]MBO6648647.1 hypothetical protein [Balneolaceae bacterium]